MVWFYGPRVFLYSQKQCHKRKKNLSVPKKSICENSCGCVRVMFGLYCGPRESSYALNLWQPKNSVCQWILDQWYRLGSKNPHHWFFGHVLGMLLMLLLKKYLIIGVITHLFDWNSFTDSTGTGMCVYVCVYRGLVFCKY